jgi:3-oxoacyl-[acyl-carrier protein] reductase
MNRIDLAGRVAVITGGGAGIGGAIAQRMAQSGARVMLWDRDRDALARAQAALGGATAAYAVDVSDAAAVDRATAATVDALGGIDILVCSAGITGPNTTTWEYPVDDWRRVFDVNVHGLFYCNRAVVPVMQRKDYGRIVNIASVAGKEGNPNAAPYSASKAAVIALTKSLGKELAGYDIAVNCITPAAAKTPIFDQMSEEHIGYMLAKIPRQRFVLVEEVAALAAFAASAECSFTTGAVFDISGGRATY